MPKPTSKELKSRIKAVSLRILKWGDSALPIGVRSVVGALFMIGGVFGFLPIIGFWMFPLGLALVALDIPWTKHRIHNWMDRMEKRPD